MKEIEIRQLNGIADDDTALDLLVKSLIGFEEGEFVFILPFGTTPETKEKFDIFCSKLNFMFSSTKRNTKLLGSKMREVIVPALVAVAEPEVVPEPVAAPAPAPAFVSKRKK